MSQPMSAYPNEGTVPLTQVPINPLISGFDIPSTNTDVEMTAEEAEGFVVSPIRSLHPINIDTNESPSRDVRSSLQSQWEFRYSQTTISSTPEGSRCSSQDQKHPLQDDNSSKGINSTMTSEPNVSVSGATPNDDKNQPSLHAKDQIPPVLGICGKMDQRYYEKLNKDPKEQIRFQNITSGFVKAFAKWSIEHPEENFHSAHENIKEEPFTKSLYASAPIMLASPLVMTLFKDIPSIGEKFYKDFNRRLDVYEDAATEFMRIQQERLRMNTLDDPLHDFATEQGVKVWFENYIDVALQKESSVSEPTPSTSSYGGEKRQ